MTVLEAWQRFLVYAVAALFLGGLVLGAWMLLTAPVACIATVLVVIGFVLLRRELRT